MSPLVWTREIADESSSFESSTAAVNDARWDPGTDDGRSADVVAK